MLIYMNQKGSVNILVIVIALAVVGVLGYLVLTREGEVVEQDLQVVADETANWNVYHGEEHGFEFRHPAVFEGNVVSVKSSSQEDSTGTRWFTLMESRVWSEKGSGSYITVPEIQLTVQRLSDAYLFYGVDLGGQGGYEYDPEESVWRARDSWVKPSVRTWEEMFQLFLDHGRREVKTASGQSAFSYRSCAYESCSSGYTIYDFQKSLVFGFMFSYVPQDGLSEMGEYDKKLLTFLEKIVQTVR
ncbi:hypothetical protein CL629_03260 [bacterium]|nr:hypothetical protein [bacterium]|tara:strand:+ start:3952 stop:4683 length:732 start_codon:yes stop_codon:yes gene_type:complete